MWVQSPSSESTGFDAKRLTCRKSADPTAQSNVEFETPVKGPKQVHKLLPRPAGDRPGVLKPQGIAAIPVDVATGAEADFETPVKAVYSALLDMSAEETRRLNGAVDAWLRGRQRLDGSTAMKRQPGDGAGFAGAVLDVEAFSAATDGNRKCC